MEGRCGQSLISFICVLLQREIAQSFNEKAELDEEGRV